MDWWNVYWKRCHINYVRNRLVCKMESKQKIVIIIVFVVGFSALISKRFIVKFKSGECGARSLFSVASQLGDRRTEEGVKRYFRGDLSNTSMEEISSVAQKFGFKTEAMRLTVEDLRRLKPLGILHIDEAHFVGLVGYDSQAFRIAETAYEGPPRVERWTDGDLKVRWDGVILVISKPENGKLEGVMATKTTPSPLGDSHGKSN
jgi:ABC-type bacteriocin/lantibiotic exporter with double-glycine peptidase domain